MQRFAPNEGITTTDFDEFYFLTNPDVMKHICYPEKEEMLLLTEPWTREQFWDSPFFDSNYFSFGWQLISPFTCIIRPDSGYCIIEIFCPKPDSKLTYELFFNEIRSGKTFPTERPAEQYVMIHNWTKHVKSVMVRLPVTGIYKLCLRDIHQEESRRLVDFRIDCDEVAPEIQPFPSNPEVGFGYSDAAVSSGLLEPSREDGVVPVTGGDEIQFHFKVYVDVSISGRLVHFSRTPENLKNNVSVRREQSNVTITASLPADDPSPEYSLELDAIRNTQNEDKMSRENKVLNYLLTSDEKLKAVAMDQTIKKNLQCIEDVCVAVAKDDAEMLNNAIVQLKMAGVINPLIHQKVQSKEARYERLQKEMLAAVKERNLYQLNHVLRDCMAVKLQCTNELSDAKKLLLELCKEELVNAATKEIQKLGQSLSRIASTCVAEEVQGEDWFTNAQEICNELDELHENQRKVESLKGEDMVTMFKPDDSVVNVLFATFFLLGESPANLNTWQKVWAKLKETSEEELPPQKKYTEARM